MEYLLSVDNDDWNIVDGVLKDCWIDGRREITVPDGVIEIDSFGMAFNFDVCVIRIPTSVKLIRRSAFDSDENLRDIYIDNPEVVIECGAFSELDSLENIYIGGSRIEVMVTCDELNGKSYYCLEKYLGKDEVYIVDDDIGEIGEKAFFNNKILKKIVMPDGLERISDEAFSGCTSLEKAELGQSLYSVGARAFADCVNIRKINFPSMVFNIESEAFSGWTEDQSITVPKDVKRFSKHYSWKDGCRAKIDFY